MAEKDAPPEYTEQGTLAPAGASSSAATPQQAPSLNDASASHLQTAQFLESLSATLSSMASAMRTAPTPAAAVPFSDAARAALSSTLAMLDGSVTLSVAGGPLPSEPTPTIIGLRDKFRTTGPTTLRVSFVGSQNRIHVERGGSSDVPEGRIMASIIRPAECRVDLGFYSPSSEVLLLLKAASGGRAQLVEPLGRGIVATLKRADVNGDEYFGMKVSVHNAYATKGSPWMSEEVLTVEAIKGLQGDLIDGAVRSRGGKVCVLFHTATREEFTMRVAEGFDMLLAGAIVMAAAQYQSILAITSTSVVESTSSRLRITGKALAR